MPITINTLDQSVSYSDGLPSGPSKAVGAIFVADESEYAANPLKMKRCLGTGFMVSGYDFHFLTAQHVVANALGENEVRVLVLPHPINNDSLLSFPIASVTALEHTDAAFGVLEATEGNTSLYGFQIAQNIDSSKDCATYEHSGTRCRPDGSIYFNVRLRKGYIIAQSKYEFGVIEGSDILEMSYPCLLGASGSPVFEHTNLGVVGLMVQNVDHDLAPSQVITNRDDDGELVEEIKYTIPEGIAISVSTLNAELNRHQMH